MMWTIEKYSDDIMDWVTFKPNQNSNNQLGIRHSSFFDESSDVYIAESKVWWILNMDWHYWTTGPQKR